MQQTTGVVVLMEKEMLSFDRGAKWSNGDDFFFTLLSERGMNIIDCNQKMTYCLCI